MSQLSINFRIKSIDLNSFAITQFPKVWDENIISFEIKYSEEFRLSEKEFKIYILINVFEEHQPDIKLCSLQTTTSFEIFNLKELIKDGEVPNLILENLLGISLSTTRGILFSSSSVAGSKPIIFPVVFPAQLIEGAKNDNSLESILKKASNYSELKNYNKALELLLKAYELYPQHELMLLNNLGIVHAHLKDYNKALICFNQVIEKNPKTIDAYINIGHVLSTLDRYEEALENVNRALENSPLNQLALINKGILLVKMNRLEEAKANFEYLLNIYPNSVKAYNNLAEIYKRTKEYSKAIELALKAVDLDNSFNVPYATLAEIYSELNQIEKAKFYLSKALQLGYSKEEVLQDISMQKVLSAKEIQELLN